jgi:hypothetical protein
MSPLPLHRPRDLRRRRCISHDRRRIAGHYFGPADPARAAAGRDAVGVTCAAFYGIFGQPEAAFHCLPRPSATLIAFPGSFGGQMAVLKHEIEEIKRVRGGLLRTGGAGSSSPTGVAAFYGG